MATQQIEATRIERLNDRPERVGRYVLYWMQAAQRARHNPALEHAVRRANARGLPVLVAFGLMDDFPEANLRHYAFMLQGLADAQAALTRRGIRFVLRHGHPAEVALALGQDAALIVTDRGYLRAPRQWRQRVAIEAACAVDQVEGEVVVPVEVVTDKAEFAARTIRKKLHRHLDDHLRELRPTPVRRRAPRTAPKGWDAGRPKRVLDQLKIDRSVPPVKTYVGGAREAKRLLNVFLRTRLKNYTRNHSRPEHDDVSCMSPYLHFGHISPVEIAVKIRRARSAPKADRDAYLEELIVRRELSCNFTQFQARYDQYAALPHWARQTLDRHRKDRREHVYTLEQLEAGETHDPYWNAAMREMAATGFMHNFMRMYWGKKILEWSETPEDGYARALHLNNKHFLDGRDPNSFANVGWLFGLHDRPWQERPVFGKVRYMNANGLRRKCDIDGYIDKVAARAEAEGD